MRGCALSWPAVMGVMSTPDRPGTLYRMMGTSDLSATRSKCLTSPFCVGFT